METNDSDTLRQTLIPPKNYDQLSLSELLIELYKENQALDKFDRATRGERSNPPTPSNPQPPPASKSGALPNL